MAGSHLAASGTDDHAASSTPWHSWAGSDVDPRLVVGLASGELQRDLAAALGCSERTIRRRAAAPEVRRAVAEYRREMADRALGRLSALLDQAVEAMAVGLAAETKDSLHAADLILRHASRLTSEIDTRFRLAALEEELVRLRNSETDDAAAEGQ